MAGLIVGYDGSDGANAALREAVDLSKRLDARLTLVFGFEEVRWAARRSTTGPPCASTVRACSPRRLRRPRRPVWRSRRSWSSEPPPRGWPSSPPSAKRT